MGTGMHWEYRQNSGGGKDNLGWSSISGFGSRFLQLGKYYQCDYFGFSSLYVLSFTCSNFLQFPYSLPLGAARQS